MDSVEAIAFRLYSLPEAAVSGAAAWTCLAAVLASAAAAGLWRLRAYTTTAMIAESEPPQPPPAISSPRVSSPERSPEPASPPKERYTSFYYDSGCIGCCHVDDDGEDDDDDDDDDAEEVVDGDDGVYEPFEWEGVGPARRTVATELGWYGYRDLTAVNGGVVQLWGGPDRGMTAMSSRRRRGRVGISVF